MCQIRQENPINLNCIINNLKYSDEYLYASNNIFTTGILIIKNPHHNIYTIPIESVDDYRKIKWIITTQKGDQSNGTLSVTIMSYKGDYLCASNLYHDLFNQRRRVYLKTNNSKKKVTKNCEWRLERVGDYIFKIWSDWLNEPLYSPSFFYKRDIIKRHVYLWKHQSKSSSDEYQWFIDCDKSISQQQ